MCVETDLWSAGCVLAELSLLRPLFAGETSLDQLVEIIKVRLAEQNVCVCVCVCVYGWERGQLPVSTQLCRVGTYSACVGGCNHLNNVMIAAVFTCVICCLLQHLGSPTPAEILAMQPEDEQISIPRLEPHSWNEVRVGARVCVCV